MPAEKCLKGKQIGIMREAEKSAFLSSQIQECGGTALFFPLITVSIAESSESFEKINSLSLYDWIVFTSSNGVKFFFEHLNRWQKNWPEHVKAAAVGPSTARSLAEYGVKADSIPESFSGANMASTLKKEAHGKKILFPKGNLAPQLIKEELQGITDVDEWIVYNTSASDIDLDGVEEMDSLVFMSPSAVTVFVEKKPFLSFDWSKPVFCIGPSTALQAEKAGFLQVKAPEEYTQEGIFNNICRYYKEA